MTKRLKSKFKVDRRLLQNTWGLQKSSFNKKKTKPGIHRISQHNRKPNVKYFLEKCKIKAFYANISEKYLKKIFNADIKNNRALYIFNILERRLDTILFRSSMAKTFFEARQMINHCHILVNGKVVNLPSYVLQPGDKVSCSAKAKEKIRINFNSIERELPCYIFLNKGLFECKLVSVIENISDVNFPFLLDIKKVISFVRK